MITGKIFILFLLVFLTTTICKAQKILALDTYKLFGFKRIRFNEGDNITFRMKGDKVKYGGEILSITDSTIEISGMDVSLKMIDVIYRDKSNFLIRDFSKVFIWCGLGFIILDTSNNLINKDPVIVNDRALIAGGSLMFIGGAMKFLSIRKYKIGCRRTLKVIDVNGN